MGLQAKGGADRGGDVSVGRMMVGGAASAHYAPHPFSLPPVSLYNLSNKANNNKDMLARGFGRILEQFKA
jgi:hypothetical protein